MKKPAQECIKENMTRNLITIGWNERMDTAYRRMKDNRIRHLPVHNDAGEIVGILSDRDVQRAMISTVVPEALAEFSAEHLDFDPEVRVKNYMSWPVETVEQSSDIKQVAREMIRKKISAFLVQSEGQIRGIVTAEDLLRVLVDILDTPEQPADWSLASALAVPFQRLDSTAI